MRLDALLATILPFGAILARVSAFAITCPWLLPDNVPVFIRSGVCLILSFVITLGMPPLLLPEPSFMVIMGELGMGLGLGLSLRTLAMAPHLAGELFDIGVGYGFSQVVNPMTGDQVGPLTHLSELCAGILFFVVGGHHVFLRALAQTFIDVPPGQVIFGDGHWAEILVERIGTLLATGFRMALPVVLALIAAQLFLAFLSRVAPQLNIWGVGFVATTALGLFGLWLYAPAYVGELSELCRLSMAQTTGGVP